MRELEAMEGHEQQSLSELFEDLVKHWLLFGHAYRLDDGSLVIDKETAEQLIPIINEFGYLIHEKK